MKKYISQSPADTAAAAAEFAGQLHGGDVVAFTGDLGAGKTFFTSACVRALGAEAQASSPTFAIVNDYGADAAGRHVYHFDMYRVTDWDSLYSTGFYDYLTPDSILFVEWSENIDGALPGNAIRVDISKGEAENARLITITGGDGRW